MTDYIVKIRDCYLGWSTVSDAPITRGMTRDECLAWSRIEEGRLRIDHEARIARADQYGTSLYEHMSAEDAISENRAGPGDARLTLDEIYRRYCLREEAEP